MVSCVESVFDSLEALPATFLACRFPLSLQGMSAGRREQLTLNLCTPWTARQEGALESDCILSTTMSKVMSDVCGAIAIAIVEQG